MVCDDSYIAKETTYRGKFCDSHKSVPVEYHPTWRKARKPSDSLTFLDSSIDIQIPNTHSRLEPRPLLSLQPHNLHHFPKQEQCSCTC